MWPTSSPAQDQLVFASERISRRQSTYQQMRPANPAAQTRTIPDVFQLHCLFVSVEGANAERTHS